MAAALRFRNGLNQIDPVYQINWPYAVWQLRFDSFSGLIAVECRDADTLQTNFGVFNGTTGEMLLPDYRPAKAWWLNLADIDRNQIYLQGIAAKGVGQSVGITAVGVKDRQIKWVQPALSFYALSDAVVLALPGTGESADLISLNPATGAVENHEANMAAQREQLADWQEQRHQLVNVPVHYPADNYYFNDLKEFVQEKLGVEVALGADYLVYKDKIALGFYLKQASGQHTYSVALFGLSGKLYWQEDMEKDLPGIGRDNFFIFRDTLILIKNKKSLLGYAV